MIVFKIFKSLSTVIRKFTKNAFYRARFFYVHYRKKLPIDEKAILFESFSGDDFTGNPFYLLLESRPLDRVVSTVEAGSSKL